MNVIFSNMTYVEVKEQRMEVFKRFETFDSHKEMAIHYCFKRFPFFIIYLRYAGFIIGKCLPAVNISVFNYLNSLSKDASLERLFAVYVLSGAVSCGVTAVALIFAYVVIFFVVRKVLPRKTPITDKENKYKCFWKESYNAEKALAVMDEIGKLSVEDIRYSEIIVEKDSDEITLFLKDSKWGLTKKQKYTITHKDMMKKLRETGELDFSFIDEEWSSLRQKYLFELQDNKN